MNRLYPCSRNPDRLLDIHRIGERYRPGLCQKMSFRIFMYPACCTASSSLSPCSRVYCRLSGVSEEFYPYPIGSPSGVVAGPGFEPGRLVRCYALMAIRVGGYQIFLKGGTESQKVVAPALLLQRLP